MGTGATYYTGLIIWSFTLVWYYCIPISLVEIYDGYNEDC